MALLKKKSPDVMPPDLQNAEERLQQSDLVNTNVPKKKSASPALLGGGAVALVALALGGWYFLGAKSVSSTDAADDAVTVSRPPVPPSPPAGAASTAPKAAGSASAKATAQRVAPRNRPGQNPQVAALKRAAVNRPGRVGIKPPGVPANVPALAPERPGLPPRLVPVQGAPTPIAPPDGLEGTPGRRGGRNDIVISRPLATAPLPQLKELWNQGAAAKQRGDFAAARRAWTRILQLSPGHPGIQQALNKLN